MGKLLELLQSQDIIRKVGDDGFELVHDTLATPIASKISPEKKSRAIAKSRIKDRFAEYEKNNRKKKFYLDAGDLSLIGEKVEDLSLTSDEKKYLEKSRFAYNFTQRFKLFSFIGMAGLAILAIASLIEVKQQKTENERNKYNLDLQSKELETEKLKVADSTKNLIKLRNELGTSEEIRIELEKKKKSLDELVTGEEYFEMYKTFHFFSNLLNNESIPIEQNLNQNVNGPKNQKEIIDQHLRSINNRNGFLIRDGDTLLHPRRPELSLPKVTKPSDSIPKEVITENQTSIFSDLEAKNIILLNKAFNSLTKSITNNSQMYPATIKLAELEFERGNYHESKKYFFKSLNEKRNLSLLTHQTIFQSLISIDKPIDKMKLNEYLKVISDPQFAALAGDETHFAAVLLLWHILKNEILEKEKKEIINNTILKLIEKISSPDNLQIITLANILKMEKSRINQIENYFKKIKLDEKYALEALLIASEYSKNKVSYLKLAIEIDRAKSYNELHNLGVSYEDIEEFESALNIFETMSQVFEKDIHIIWHQAMNLFRTENIEEAKKNFELIIMI